LLTVDRSSGEVLDAHTVKFTFKHPTRTVLPVMAADAALVPQLQQAVGGAALQMRGTPIRRIGEGYEPKA
jgi:hypothetical protein